MTEQRRDALRTAVLDAADARVAASGLADLGVREIAREAGCSSGMVYKLFTNHDELVLSVNARTLAALADAIGASLALVEDPAAALHAMADAYLAYASANIPRWDALFTHRMAGGAAVPGWYAAQRDRMFDGVRDAVANVSTLPTPDFARTLFSAVHGVVALGLQQKVGDVDPAALRAEVRALAGLLARGMSGPRR